MSETKHTPGPWSVYPPTKCVIGPEPERILVAEASHHRPEADANARLIAAAPDLLAACERLLALVERFDRWHPSGDAQDEIERTKEILARVKGD